MKRIVLVSILTALIVPLGVVKARAQSKDEAAIRKVFADFAEAWAKDDAKSMASMWTEDGDLINPQGRVATGRAEVEKLFGDEHSTVFKASHISFTPGTIRLVKPDVAVFTTDYDVPDAHGPNGSPMDAKGTVTSVMVKKGGKWMTFSARPMVPQSAPSQ
ncbi:MAG: hypothetical protein DMG21_07375 [Acidobacteria bacterium]|nr:MAG: hypothetical protein DMG21_07375 [Acidobacteriota bacterium]